MGWPGPLTDWQYQVYMEHLMWENHDPNVHGPRFEGDPEVWKRWQTRISKARFDLSSAALNKQRGTRT